MTAIYHRMTDRDHQELARVTKTAGKLAKQTFKLPIEFIAYCIHNKVCRLAIATAVADDALVTFDTPHQADIEHLNAIRLSEIKVLVLEQT